MEGGRTSDASEFKRRPQGLPQYGGFASSIRRHEDIANGETSVRAKEWKRAAAPLDDALPGFGPIRFGLVREHRWLAECVYADTSSFKRERFFLNAFVLPLFIPTDRLYFNYGFRIGTHWDGISAEDVDAVIAALPRCEDLTSWPGLRAAAKNWRINLRHAELRLCIGILQSDDTLLSSTRQAIETWQPSREWENDLLERNAALLSKLDRDGRDAAIRHLEARRTQVTALLQ